MLFYPVELFAFMFYTSKCLRVLSVVDVVLVAGVVLDVASCCSSGPTR